MMRAFRLLALSSLFFVTLSTAAQNFGPGTEYVDWQISDTVAVAPGSTGELALVATIPDSLWKMYALDASPPGTRGAKPRPLKLRLDELPEGVSMPNDPAQSTPIEDFDENFNLTVRFFKKHAEVYAALAAAERVAPGDYPASGSIEFQICHDGYKICLRPERLPFSFVLQVDPDAPPAPVRTVDAPAMGAATPGVITPADDYATARAGGLWAFLLLAAGAGLAALITPCVFPMIPLTVSYFTKHADDRGQAVRMASVYGFSMIATFTLLGLLMAVFVGAAGAQRIAANPWINLFIAFVLIGFALSLLGLYELRLPSGLVNYMNQQSNERSGYLGVVFMGLTLTLVSFSCTAPFVGGLLAAAAGGDWTYPLLGMLVFSTMFALPFVLFALFPRALAALPRSGSWLNAVKVVLGFVELAAALKFLSNADLVWGWSLLSRPLAIALTVVIFFLTGMYLIGKLRLAHDTPLETVGVGRLMAAIGFFGFSLYLLPGMLGAPLNSLDAYLPPRSGSDISLLVPAAAGVTTEDDLPWFVDDLEGARAAASAAQKPLFIDFTGYSCTNCRQMEANVFPHPRVAQQFANDYILLKLYTDGIEQGDAFARYQLQLTGTVALPTYAVVHPETQQLLARVSGMFSVEDFADFLAQGRTAYASDAVAQR